VNKDVHNISVTVVLMYFAYSVMVYYSNLFGQA